MTTKNLLLSYCAYGKPELCFQYLEAKGVDMSVEKEMYYEDKNFEKMLLIKKRKYTKQQHDYFWDLFKTYSKSTISKIFKNY
jgi:hypothetical protein